MEGTKHMRWRWGCKVAMRALVFGVELEKIESNAKLEL